MIGLAKKITKKTLIINTIIFLIFIIGINVLSGKFSSIYGTVILDFNFGYTSQVAYDALLASGESGRNAYLLLLKFDFIFPISYAVFGFTLLSYLLNKSNVKNNIWYTLTLIPICGMVCDWMENILIILMIKTFPNDFGNIGEISSIFTILKFLFIILTLLTSLILFINLKINDIKKKKG